MCARPRSGGARPSGSRLPAVPPQVLSPGGRDRHECPAARLMVALDEAEVCRVLPNGEARARGSPRLEGLGVGPFAGADPLEQIKDQVATVWDTGTVRSMRPDWI